MDDTQKVISTVIRATLYPREEVSVGWKAKSAYFGHRVLFDLSERLPGYASDKLQLDISPLAFSCRPAQDCALAVRFE